MGSDYKTYGGKCGCSKRLKKAQRVPQRGPGVAELEKILRDQKHNQIKPFYGTPAVQPMYHQPPLLPPHYHQLRPVQHQSIIVPPHPQQFDGSENLYVKAWSQNVMNSDQIIVQPDSRLNFTQMMTMGEPHEHKTNGHHMFHPNMNSPHPVPPASNTGIEHSSSQVFSSKSAPAWAVEDKYPLKRPQVEMAEQPHHPLYVQQLGLAEQDKLMLRNVLTLGPSSPKNGSPMLMESDSSEEPHKDVKTHCSSEVHSTQIFGFNLKEKDLTLDDTKLSLHHPVSQAEPDLDLKL